MNEPTPEDDIENGELEPEPPQGHWQLLRDVIALQFKLALDGVLDLLMSPASIAAAIAGFILHREDPGRYFYQLLELGHRGDKWINLYGAGEPGDDTPSSDHYVRKVEGLIKDEYHKGGVVKSIKNHTDDLIDRMRKR